MKPLLKTGDTVMLNQLAIDHHFIPAGAKHNGATIHTVFKITGVIDWTDTTVADNYFEGTVSLEGCCLTGICTGHPAHYFDPTNKLRRFYVNAVRKIRKWRRKVYEWQY